MKVKVEALPCAISTNYKGVRWVTTTRSPEVVWEWRDAARLPSFLCLGCCLHMPEARQNVSRHPSSDTVCSRALWAVPLMSVGRCFQAG